MILLPALSLLVTDLAPDSYVVVMTVFPEVSWEMLVVDLSLGDVTATIAMKAARTPSVTVYQKRAVRTRRNSLNHMTYCSRFSAAIVAALSSPTAARKMSSRF